MGIVEHSGWHHMPGFLDGQPEDLIQCERCARTQTIRASAAPGGITTQEAASLGWSETQTGWICPFCSDAGPTKLKAIFQRGSTTPP